MNSSSESFIQIQGTYKSPPDLQSNKRKFKNNYLVRQVRELDCLGAGVLVDLNLVVTRNGQKSTVTEL